MRHFCCLMFLVALPGIAHATDALAASKPNVVFILVDDPGYYDLGCYGATEVKTPHIDALADGARTAWHTHPLGQTLIVTSGLGCFRFGEERLRRFARAPWCGFRRE